MMMTMIVKMMKYPLIQVSIEDRQRISVEQTRPKAQEESTPTQMQSITVISFLSGLDPTQKNKKNPTLPMPEVSTIFFVRTRTAVRSFENEREIA